MASDCPACGGTDLRVFHRQHDLPVHSCLLVDTREEALAFPTGDMELRFCRTCGFVGNALFDSTLQGYSEHYEETQGFSSHFRQFAEDLARRWIDAYDLHGKRVVEIGCGKGEFLQLLVSIGGNEGVGIDPAYVPGRLAGPGTERMRFVQELYNAGHASIEADAVVCRHTLEHIAPVADFMRTVRAAIGDRREVAVLFELPDVLRVLREVAFWDVYYEHCSYFTPGSLCRLFRHTGFEVLDVALDYDDQYILIEARAATTPQAPRPEEDDLDDLAKAVDYFEASYTEKVAGWRTDLAARRADGQRVAIWGSGSKGVAYLTTMGADAGIELVVDINPHKQGKFMASTGQRILSPEELVEARPDLVVAMNPVYLGEIQADLDRLGIRAELVVV